MYMTSDAPCGVATTMPPMPTGTFGDKVSLALAALSSALPSPSFLFLASDGGASNRAGKLVHAVSGPFSFVPSRWISVVLPGGTPMGTTLAMAGWAVAVLRQLSAQRKAI